MLHKGIKGYEDYLISDRGQVYSLKRKKYLKLRKNSNGYYCIDLCKNGKRKTVVVHRLVAQAFIENPDNKPTVDHISRDRLDNRVENLRWATYQEQLENRNLSEYKSKQRKNLGIPIIEKINDEVSIGYLSLHSVPNIDDSTLTNHISKGETHFYAKGRHFIMPQ